jgi:Alginate lyase
MSYDFVHPGILVSRAQLEFVKKHQSEEPWATSMRAALAHPYASRDYSPSPRVVVECGAYSNPDIGCSDETRDAQVAYLQALLWYYTNEVAYAETVRRILNAWATTLQSHTGDNRRLQTSWSAQLFTRAAEIVKYTYSDWPQSEKDAVTRMFLNLYLPIVKSMFDPSNGNDHQNNSNWQASAIEAMVNIAIFIKDPLTYAEAIGRWVFLVPGYIYLTSDGRRPRDVPWLSRTDEEVKAKWSNPSRYIDGMPMEFCRDIPHSGYGIAAIINVAETARIQGLDLYALHKERITKAMEVLSYYGMDHLEHISDYKDVCGKEVANWARGALFIGYNHYAFRDGVQLPETLKFITKHPTYAGTVHYQWERLTHYEIDKK